MMKNWFAAMAAAMAAASDMTHNYRAPSRRGRVAGSPGVPGSKLLRKVYEHKNGKVHRSRGGATYAVMADYYKKLPDGKYKAGHRRRITGQPLKF